MIRISQIIGLSRLSTRRYPKSIRNVRIIRIFLGIRSSLKKYECGIQPMKISLLLSTSQFTVVNLEDKEEDDREGNDATTSNPVHEFCNTFVSSTMDFLNIVFDTISDSALQYKTALNELCSCLEKYETTREFARTLDELEDAIISARAKVFDCERKYLGMITVVRSIEKLASAVGELSFLLGEENLSLVLKNTLYSVCENMKLDSTEIKRIKERLNSYESTLILSPEIRNDENENNNANNDGNSNSDDSNTDHDTGNDSDEKLNT